MPRNYILAIDQGTTSTRAVVFDKKGNPLGTARKPHQQIFPQAGWVSHDAEEIFINTIEIAQGAIEKARVSRQDLAAIGITNQRETLVLWDVRTGKPVCDAIVWQCRRSADICAQMEKDGMAGLIRERTGLLIDPYFTATKIKWALDNIPSVRPLMAQGYLRAGTIDSYLIFRLTKGKSHITDYTNAARTMLFDIVKGCWDDDILRYLGIDQGILPQVVSSSGVVAHTDVEYFDVPIAGIAGDQHAALFGQADINPGDAKNTYGTGCFLLKNIGDEAVINKDSRLLTTIAWHINGKTTYALEGGVFNAGSAVEWLMRELKLTADVQEINEICANTPDTDGAYFVPAFSGLGAPYWDMYARGTLCGLSLSTGKNHIVRAVMESIAFQSRDLIDHMNEIAGLPLTQLQVDGGVSKSDFTMQFQADLLGIPVERPSYTETTVLGACYLAALGVGWFTDLEDIARSRVVDRVFVPSAPRNEMEQRYRMWKNAVKRAEGWLNTDYDR
ncbi:MAG: glycerol kinase GlpK [Defluviitaleaceae bacterium]|nr:glycerol kinase GlpK [Defluviitaleaceae bacterium]